jgi:hypothetical protein
MLFSDTAFNSSEANAYRIDEHSESEPYAEPRSRTREWKPGVDGWKIKRADCPAFFSREIEGFGVFQVGPRCVDEEVPYAL